MSEKREKILHIVARNEDEKNALRNQMRAIGYRLVETKELIDTSELITAPGHAALQTTPGKVLCVFEDIDGKEVITDEGKAAVIDDENEDEGKAAAIDDENEDEPKQPRLPKMKYVVEFGGEGLLRSAQTMLDRGYELKSFAGVQQGLHIELHCFYQESDWEQKYSDISRANLLSRLVEQAKEHTRYMADERRASMMTGDKEEKTVIIRRELYDFYANFFDIATAAGFIRREDLQLKS